MRWLTHWSNCCSWSSYYVPGTTQGADTAVNTTKRYQLLWRLHLSKSYNKQENLEIIEKFSNTDKCHEKKHNDRPVWGWRWTARQAEQSRRPLWRGVMKLLVGWQESKDSCDEELAGAKDLQREAKNWRVPGRERRAGACWMVLSRGAWRRWRDKQRAWGLVGNGKHLSRP